MSDSIKEKNKALEKRLKATKKFILVQKKKYKRMAASQEFKPMAGYAQKERWDDGFQQAQEALNRANQLADTELAPLIRKNDPQDEVKAMVQINRIDKVIAQAKTLAQAPFVKVDRIRSAMDHPQDIYITATDAARTIQEKLNALNDGPVAKAKQNFPESLTRIDKRLSPFAKIEADTQSRLARVEKEYQNFTAGNPVDYSAFIAGADGIEKDATALVTQIPEMEKELETLYQSYTKVLQDMKVAYYVTVKRESWDENSDAYHPAFASFRREVSPAVFQTLTESNLESIAELLPRFGRLYLKNKIGEAWTDLNINPVEDWPGYLKHNSATFFIDDETPEYFHKYILETNGETSETDWEKVTPSFFEQNINNLGMAILSKPYGEFEPDTMAAPPGIAYVGNPAYGEWKKGENGENFWSWYGRYAFFSNLFFFPPYHYYYGNWNRWHSGYRHQRPYYGTNKSGKQMFGTQGSMVKTSPRYQNSTFARTGGFKTGPASIRGTSMRGGGPKGKGK